ncbi:MAG: hypothetical protein ABI569_16315 [Casimicrobiaceae bacterium]
MTDNVNGTIRNSSVLGASGASYGVRAQGSSGNTTVVAIQNSLVSGHAYGVYSDGQSLAFGASMSVVDTNVSQNEFALQATNGGTIALANSRVTHNQFGATVGAASFIFTDGRNFFGYNLADLNGSSTLFGPIGIR